MDMTNTNAVAPSNVSLPEEGIRLVDLSDLQLVLVGGGIGDTQL